MPDSSSFILFFLLIELVFLLFYRRVNLDEGWYLWASKLVYEGKQLYQDFAYTQTPLLPYVYGLWLQISGEGLMQGRLLTLFFTLATFLLSAAGGRRLAGKEAGWLCLALLATSFFALGQYSYTATYALTALCLTAACVVSLAPWSETPRNVLAAILVTLAVAVRLSVIVALPIFLLYLLLTSRQRGKAFFWIALATLVTFLITVGWHWWQSSELMQYDIFGFHTDRFLKLEWQLARVRMMIGRTLFDFAPLLAVTLWAGLAGLGNAWQQRRRLAEARQPLLFIALAGMTLSLFAIHLVPRTTDSYYNALQTPLMTLAGAAFLTQWRQQSAGIGQHRWVILPLVLLANAGLQGSAAQRDGLVNLPLQNQVAIVRRAATFLQTYSPDQSVILTFDVHLALEAGRRVAPGYEMSVFAYRPTWSDEEAARYRVINNRRLINDLTEGVAAVALTQFDMEQLYGEREQILAHLQEGYRWVKTVRGFGPFGDDLRIFLPAQFGPVSPQTPVTVKLQNGVTLAGYDSEVVSTVTGKVLDVALYWRVEEPPAEPYTVFVQLLDANGALVTSWDNQPCHSTCPLPTWQAGEWVRDEYTLSLPAEVADGTYQLLVGMYDSVTVQRVRIVTEGGGVGEDAIRLGTIQLGAGQP